MSDLDSQSQTKPGEEAGTSHLKNKRILIVDDVEDNRDLIEVLLEDAGYTNLALAEDGQEAIDRLREDPDFDLILLDIFMPRLNGYDVLETIQADNKLREIPVIMISAHDKLDSVIRCIEGGAVDYITKPVEETFLLARVRSTLDRKFLQDRQRELFRQVEVEKQKSERLLYQVLPETVADRLRRGARRIADNLGEVTVLFADLVGFTEFSGRVAPENLVDTLNTIFDRFDALAAEIGVEKVKTIGDAYMVVGGLPPNNEAHAEKCLQFALKALEVVQETDNGAGQRLNLRVGMNTGPAVAGVIGHTRFTYDLWGESVNIASRMEAMGVPGWIQVSETTWDQLKNQYVFQQRGEIGVKGKGPMRTFLTREDVIHSPELAEEPWDPES
ncbi:MAG: adenylate/guanylate cyclase domain-containing protein [Opitutales bacterium]